MVFSSTSSGLRGVQTARTEPNRPGLSPVTHLTDVTGLSSGGRAHRRNGSGLGVSSEVLGGSDEHFFGTHRRHRQDLFRRNHHGMSFLEFNFLEDYIL